MAEERVEEEMAVAMAEVAMAEAATAMAAEATAMAAMMAALRSTSRAFLGVKTTSDERGRAGLACLADRARRDDRSLA